MSGKNGFIDRLIDINWANLFSKLAFFIWNFFREFYFAVTTKTFPWVACSVAGTLLGFCLSQHWDIAFAEWFSQRWFNIVWLLPHRTGYVILYKAAILTLPFWGWVIVKVGQKQRLKRQLQEVFSSAGLKSLYGRTPGFVFDLPVDEHTRKLRVRRYTLTKDQFEKARTTIESGLKIFVDEIREDRTGGTIDIIYSKHPMPTEVKIENLLDIGENRICVGVTRSKTILSSFNEVPHLLVAGQTSGGKSTFLRQLITTLYLNNPGAHFTLVDLKGGLEFQLFENVERIEVMPSIRDAIRKLVLLNKALDARMKLIKANNAKDIQEFFKIPEDQRKYPDDETKKIGLDRHFIVIDEAAEMFLSGHHADAKDIQFARRVLTKIALQGRAIGVHVVIATQRPDSRALDSQVKANLTGILATQTPNDATSISILGNGRATDLPRIAGRAIWKTGADMVEVQTPLLSPEEVSRLLKPYLKLEVPTHRREVSESDGETQEENELPDSEMVSERTEEIV